MNIEELKTKLLDYYEINEADYLEMTRPEEEISLFDPDSFPTLNIFDERIKKAVKNQEKVLIYGDYDADGILGSAILLKTFYLLGYENVRTYIPYRSVDGYGLNVSNVEKIVKAGYSLIITVDNGVSATEAIEKANELGIDVLVSDHHEIPSEKLKTFATFHPSYDNIGTFNPSGAYVALIISAKLLGHYDPYLVSLASITILSDMMIILKENRDLVRLGLFYINKYRYKEIIDLVKDKSKEIDEKDISFEIVPKINACGRILNDQNLQQIPTFFATSDLKIKSKILDLILLTNEERKGLTTDAYETIDLSEFSSSPSIAIVLDINEGLTGLVANKILMGENKPTVVFVKTEKDPNIIKGSMRVSNGFNAVDFLSLNQDILLTSGGHALAAGLSLKIDDLPLFKDRFNEYSLSHPFIEKEEKAVEISLNDISQQAYELIRTFAPFGQGHREPLLAIKDIYVPSLKFSRSQEHIYHPLSFSSRLVGFGISKDSLKDKRYIKIYGHLEENLFRNINYTEFKIEKFK